MSMADLPGSDYSNRTAACHNGRALWYITTLPDADAAAGIGLPTIVVNVIYTLLPGTLQAVMIASLLHGWFSHQNSGEQRDLLEERLRKYQQTLKYVMFGVLVYILDFQRLLFRGARPTASCLGNYAFPNFLSLWSAGLFMLRWVDLMLCWSVPHLTSTQSTLHFRAGSGVTRSDTEDLISKRSSRSDTEEDLAVAAYSADEMWQLGYAPMPMRGLVEQLALLIVLLGPVPMSRLVLGDATYWQLLAGCLEGAAVAIAFHVCYVRLYQKKGVKMRARLLALLLFGGGLRRELAALGAIGADTPSGRGDASEDKRGLGTRLVKRARRISSRAGEVMSRTTSFVKEGGWTEPLLPGQDSPQRPVREPAEWSRVSDLPGLEFLAVRPDTVQHRLEKQVGGLQQTVQRQKCRNEMIDLELQGALHKLEESQLAKVEVEQEVASLHADKCVLEDERARLELQKTRTERDISNLRGDNDNMKFGMESLNQEKAHLKEEGLRRQRSAERKIGKATSRYVEEQKKLVEIRDFAEALNDLQQARALGDRARLKAAISIENMEKLAEPVEEAAHLKEEGLRRQRSAEGGFGDVEMLKHSLGGPLVKDARKTLSQWSVRLGNLREALSVARNNSSSQNRDKMTHMAQRLFSAFLAAVDTGVALQLHPDDLETCEGIKEWLNAWQSKFAVNNRHNPKCKEVQELIIGKCIGVPKKELLGSLDFTDLETCLEIVDCSPAGEHQLFLDRAREQIRKHDPEKFVTALSQLSQLTFFLEFLDKEDVTKACEKFILALHGQELGTLAARLVREAVEGYAESGGVMGRVGRNEVERDPAGVVAKMQSFHDEFIGQQLQDIFVELARSWLEEYGALAVPHHTQVVALLVFKLFLEQSEQSGGTVQTLIAQVGTGEGKSMLIAVLSVYLVLARGMRVHVVGGDEKFTLRDYERFKPLFHWAYERFETEDKPATPDRFAVVCSKSAKPADDVVSSIPDSAWIVYCEARHVTSFYTQLARTRMDFSVYDNIVLLIDEVDALVVDSNPTSEIVYNVEARPIAPGDITIGQYTTSLGACILSHRSFQAHTPQGTADPREPLFEQMQELCGSVDEWKSRDQTERDAEYVRSTETDLFTRVEGGKLDPDFRSNFLECLRLADQPMVYSMNWYERLFVVSKPRVFSKYRSILGFSGTVGNVEERRFLTEAYRAEFLIVPPFLQTCVSEKAVFHDAQWATTEAADSGTVVMHEPLPRPAVVEQDEERQREAVKELSFSARERVPVLIIAESPARAEALVDALRQHVRLALAGADPSDIVRSLSQREYEQHAASYKANLHASTRPLTERGGSDRKWRITVTDPTGGRGTDYQMTDEGANSMGGLMLIMMNIPTSERDWIQYKGRTARQKWRGQYCVVLDAQRQLGIQPGQGGDVLPGRFVEPDTSQGAGRSKAASLTEARSVGLHRWRWVPEDPEQLVSAVLKFGSEESAERLNACKTVYKAGFLANEVCERVWSAKKRMNERGTCELGLDGAHRETFVQVCEGYKYMTADEIDESSQNILGDGQALLASPHMRDYAPLGGQYGSRLQVKKIAFLMDVSYSMRSNTRPGETRIGICKERMVGMLNNEQIVRPGDSVGVLAFSSKSAVVVPIHEATPEHRRAVADLAQSRTIDGLIDKLGGGTALFQSLLWGAEMLREGASDSTGLWLIVLTDGEDSTGGTPQRCQEFFEAAGGKVNLLAIAVAERCPGLDSLCSIVRDSGGIGQFVSTASPDSSSIEQAFQVVERAIRREQGGHQEAE